MTENQLSSNMLIQEDVLKLRVENEQLKAQIDKIKKPLLDVGTKIRFSDGKIGILKRETTHYGKLYYVIELKDGVCMDFDYLVGKTWEVVV